jgi:primosomal protein N' (replication factor Y)
MSRLVSVAIPVPGLDLLTYSLPDHLDVPPVGARVLVPLGTRTVTGCFVGPAAEAPGATGGDPIEFRSVVEVLDEHAYLPESVVDVALWVADYYLAGPGETIAAAMPPGAWIESERAIAITPAGLAEYQRLSGSGACGSSGLHEPAAASPSSEARLVLLRALLTGRTLDMPALVARLRRLELAGFADRRAIVTLARRLEREGFVSVTTTMRGRRSAHKTVRMAALTAAGMEALQQVAATERRDRAGQKRLTAGQLAALEILSGAVEGVTSGSLARRGVSPATLQRLIARGLVSVRLERLERDPFDALLESPAEEQPPLTGEQAAALASLASLARRAEFRVALVHGVTGSGKTELYVRLAELVRSEGRAVLILVPEIALTPQITRRFRASFGRRVAVQHSGLSDGERYDQWQRIRRGEVDVVIGTRSAVFAPLERLGLVVVDEEHDASYKQEESPRYHGRDVAIVRAQRAGALVVLGSATPSLESSQHALAGRYERVVLERRVFDRPLAAVSIVDMRAEYAEEGPDVVLSRRLREAVAVRLTRSEQSLVLLNRRGLATAVFCRQCGTILDCPNCSLSLTVHTTRGAVHRARCHFCNYSMKVPGQCGKCQAPYLEQVGFGTERVEAALREAFPDARVDRLDRDTARRRGALADILGRFLRREIDVLVGTQMIAKGHDFPAVTLVGVVSADVGLGVADFRAGERTFQLLTQVAGRAGRGAGAGEAIVQTIHPAHYTIRHAVRQDYAGFFADEIGYRRTMRYPPVVAMINLIVKGSSLGAALELAGDLARRLAGNAATGAYGVIGPAPAPYTKLRGEHRAQLFLKGSRRHAMRSAVRAALAGLGEARRKVTVDVDPVNML